MSPDSSDSDELRQTALAIRKALGAHELRLLGITAVAARLEASGSAECRIAMLASGFRAPDR